MNPQAVLVRAAAIADARGVIAAPGAVLARGSRIVAAGSPQSIGDVPDAASVDLPDAVLLPGLVNAHAHLDLTHIGPRTFGGSFVEWINMVRRGRSADEWEITQAVQMGVELARRGGTAAIGDVAGSLAAARALAESGMAGVSFLEWFGLGQREQAAIAKMREACEAVPSTSCWRLGLQPHAPYSAGLALYVAAAGTGLPLTTHLAETLDEVRFVRRGDGPFAEMLKSFGVWDDSIAGHAKHPVELVCEAWANCRSVAAHANYVDARHIALMAQTAMSVAYCPRASSYFGHPHADCPPHQYREMIEAGVNVALGTDSIICIGREDRLSVLDEMRFLHRRDGADPPLLLRMATANGALALGFEPRLVSLHPGPTLGLVAVDVGRAADHPLERVLEGDVCPRWVIGPFGCT